MRSPYSRPSRPKAPKPARRPATRLPPNSPGRRQALELLAASPEGCTEALMLANGFSVDLLVELVREGLASVESERMISGGKQIEVARVRSTEVGRRVLAGHPGARG